MFGPCWGPCLSHFRSVGDNFWVMLGLGVPSWGPWASFGAILGSTSDFDAIFDQMHFGTILRMLTYFGSIFIMSDFLINFGRDLGGANVDEVL